MSYQGKKNIYVCDRCFGHIVTVDKDEGVTPFTLQCHADDTCSGTMYSSLYRVYRQEIGASHEWYKPSIGEAMALSRGVAEHVNMGGLLLRPIK